MKTSNVLSVIKFDDSVKMRDNKNSSSEKFLALAKIAIKWQALACISDSTSAEIKHCNSVAYNVAKNGFETLALSGFQDGLVRKTNNAYLLLAEAK